MSRLKFIRMTFYFRILSILACIITVRFFVIGSHDVWAMSSDKLKYKHESQDTLVSIVGKVIDSLTNTPIPFATITFFKNDSGNKTIVSNGKGEFSTEVKQDSSKVLLSAIGYQEQTFYLTFDQNNLIRLTPVINLLPNVNVSNQIKRKPKANRIINKVNQRIEQNYGYLSFIQKFVDYSFIRNYDTTKSKMTEKFTVLLNKNQRTFQEKKRLTDTVIFDSKFYNLIRSPNLQLGDIIPRADILRIGMVIGEKQSKNFDFRLLAHLQDKNYGAVYLVSFKPYNTNTYDDFFLRGFVKANMPLGYLTGVMLIREDDFAVVNIKYTLELNVARFNAAIFDFYQSSSWKTHIVGKIISNTRIYQFEYSYKKDAITGKYFVQTIKAGCNDSGYQVENHRKVQLDYQFDATSLGIENIVE